MGTAPWLSRIEELDEVKVDGEGVVVLTHPRYSRDDAQMKACGLGSVLKRLLKGETSRFTAVVGFFGHSDSDAVDDDPADIVAQEGAEALFEHKSGVIHDPGRARFRLLFGSVDSQAARDALLQWYWLCRWSVCHPQDAEQWRERVLESLTEEGFQSGDHAWLKAPVDSALASPLRRTNSDPSELFATFSPSSTLSRQARGFMKTLTSSDRYELNAIRSQSPGGTEFKTYANLLTYLLLTAADVRISMADVNGGVGHGNAWLRGLFHPKLYVVESERSQDRWVINGSGNWSTAAFTSVHQRGESVGNVELSTAHRIPLLRSEGEAARMPDKLAASAEHLFEQAAALAAWGHAPQVSAKQMRDALKLASIDRGNVLEEQPRSASELQTLAPALRSMVGSLLGFAPETSTLNSEEFFRKHGIGGRTPESYQLDALVRLINMMRTGREGETGQRGVFLTDETGLGKTIVAQMVAVHFLADRIVEQLRELAGEEPITELPEGFRPVRLAIVVPARLRGDSETGEKTGWNLHEQEIRSALRKWLDTNLTEQIDESVRGSVIDQLVGEVRTHVTSMQRFGQTFAQAELDEQLRTDDSVKSRVEALRFVSQADVVVIDEAHNLRNGKAHATRALRFALSLPLEGEGWLSQNVKASASNEQYRDLWPRLPMCRRKVLMVSATPFNNHIDDLFTLIGHFARLQDWCPMGPSEQAILGDFAEEPHHAICRLALPGASEDPERTDAFLALLGRMRAFLGNKRRLDPAADKEFAAELDDTDLAPRDKGPVYRWMPDKPEGGDGNESSLVKIQRQVNEWLHALERERDEARSAVEGDETRSTEEGDVAMLGVESRNRIDALLSSYFVQRSRTRILSSTKPEHAGQLFRKPWIPRHPLRLNDPENADYGIERSILESLYELLASERDEQPLAGSASRLTLHAYELAVSRGREGQSGAASETTIRNVVGFQQATLVKRLQSSTYAFFRTIVRGVLRKSLFELALLERIAAETRKDLAPTMARLRDMAREQREHFNRAWEALLGTRRREVESVIQRVCSGGAGTVKPGAKDRFRTLIGVETTRDPQWQLALASLEVAYDAVEDAESGWLNAFRRDLEEGPDESRIWSDIRLVVAWAFGIRDVEREQSLQQVVFSPLPAKFVGDLTQLSRRLSAYHANAEEAHLSGDELASIGTWCWQSMEANPRLRACVAWLLSVELTKNFVAEDETLSLTDVLRSGPKTLVFSEYSDSVEWLSCAIQALPLAFTEASPRQAAERAALLKRYMLETVESLHRQARQVRESGKDAPRSQWLKPESFQAPIDVEWHKSALEHFDEARAMMLTRMLLERSATATSARTAMLALVDKNELSAQNEIELDDLPDDERVASPIAGDDDAVSAFSPWYQIAPEADADKLRRSGFAKRLALAAQRPVDTLIATEVLSEGVNLQESGALIHFDLPWNPTKLIQRNGRVDRRIDRRYEDHEARSQLIEELGLNEVQCPAFVAPRQIVHLTLSPPTPHFDDNEKAHSAARRLRDVLFAKLETIRALFGLAAWPVVLDDQQAAQVLRGELDYETPGFRRREELFAWWNRLERLIDEARGARELEYTQSLPEGPGEVKLTMPASFASFLARRAKASEKDVGRWEKEVDALALLTWSPEGGVHRCARSATEMSNYPVFASYRVGRGAEAPWHLTWGSKSRAAVAGEDRYTVLHATSDVMDKRELSVTSLGELFETERDAEEPHSPTGLAEEVLLAALDWMDKANPIEEVEHLSATVDNERFEALTRQWQHLGNYKNQGASGFDWAHAGSEDCDFENAVHANWNLFISLASE